MKRLLVSTGIILSMAGPAGVVPAFAAAMPGEIVVWDVCYAGNGRLVAMASDGSSRVDLPSVAGGGRPKDVSTAGPVTVLVLSTPTSGQPSELHAIAIDRDGSGNLLPSSPVRLLPAGGVEPTIAAIFSPDASRVALVGRSDGTASSTTLFVADVVRDGAGHVEALSNVTEVIDLAAIGSPSDTIANQGVVGGIDYAPDGLRLIASIYDDLWVVSLGTGGRTFVDASPLTRTTNLAERAPRWSPTSDVIGFSRTGYVWLEPWGWLHSADSNIFTVPASGGPVLQLTSTPKDKWVSGPTWSPDGSTLVYSAHGTAANGKRSQPCTGVNYDLFRVRATGGAKPVNFTNTAGTSIELDPVWGW